jgi:DNA ligase (NAD+)
MNGSNVNVEKLVLALTEAKDAYYNGSPLISDAAFDALENTLREIDPQNLYFQTVGASPTGGWKKVQHSIPMGSLEKVQTDAEMLAWAMGKPRDVMITEKLDGISICLTYRGGKFVTAVTRGDGATGEDITRNVSIMRGVRKEIPELNEVQIRGEIICTKSQFAAHFQGESNPRNTASGTSKRQTGWEKAQYLTVMAYQLIVDGQPLSSKFEELMTLGRWGFQTPNWWLAEDISHVLARRQGYINVERAALDYDIDGLVIEVNDAVRRDSLGSTNMRPKGAVAFKFPHESAESVLREVKWQVGNSGRVTPVAVFDEVALAGAKVKQASLHNIARVNLLKLKIGDRILVSRRNDVIPAVEANLSEAVFVD